MIVSRASLALAGLVLTVVTAHADDGYTLRRSPRSGESDRYKTVIVVEGAAQKVTITFQTTETVKDVKQDGSYVVATQINAADVVSGEKSQTIPTEPLNFTTTYSKDGDPLKQEGGGAGPVNVGALLSLTRLNCSLTAPAKIGEEIKYEKASTDSSRPSIKGAFTLVSLEKPGPQAPVETVKLKNAGDIVVPGGQGAGQKLHIESTAYVDPKSGRLQNTDGAVTGGTFPNFGPATMRFTVTRQAEASPTK